MRRIITIAALIMVTAATANADVSIGRVNSIINVDYTAGKTVYTPADREWKQARPQRFIITVMPWTIITFLSANTTADIYAGTVDKTATITYGECRASEQYQPETTADGESCMSYGAMQHTMKQYGTIYITMFPTQIELGKSNARGHYHPPQGGNSMLTIAFDNLKER